MMMMTVINELLIVVAFGYYAREVLKTLPKNSFDIRDRGQSRRANRAENATVSVFSCTAGVL